MSEQFELVEHDDILNIISNNNTISNVLTLSNKYLSGNFNIFSHNNDKYHFVSQKKKKCIFSDIFKAQHYPNTL